MMLHESSISMQASVPSWAKVAQCDLTTTQLKGGFSPSSVIYLVQISFPFSHDFSHNIWTRLLSVHQTFTLNQLPAICHYKFNQVSANNHGVTPKELVVKLEVKSNDKTSQELRMLSSVTLNCQVTKIVKKSSFQLSEM